MTKKSFVALATLLCGAVAFATPGAYTQWFANAVPNHPTGWTNGKKVTVDEVSSITVTTDAAVTYTATAPATAYAKQTVTVTSEPLDELPATDDASLDGARFAFGVAQVGEDTAPAVYVLSKVDGVAKWTRTSVSATAGATTTVEVTYDKVAKTFTVTGDSTVFTSLIDESTDWTTTTFVGNGSVNALSGQKADRLSTTFDAATSGNAMTIDRDIVVDTGDDNLVFTRGSLVAGAEGNVSTVADTAEGVGTKIFGIEFTLSDIVYLTAKIGGGSINEANRGQETIGYLFERTSETALVQFQFNDNGTVKCATYRLYQRDDGIYAKKIRGYYGSASSVTIGTYIVSAATQDIPDGDGSYGYRAYDVNAVLADYKVNGALTVDPSKTMEVNGRVEVNVTDAETLACPITGNGELVLVGGGTLTLTGTIAPTVRVVADNGTLKVPNTFNGYIIVNENGVYDINAQSAADAYPNVRVVMNGGTLKNDGSTGVSWGAVSLCQMTFLADSTVDVGANAIFAIASNKDKFAYNLNGKKLTKTGTGEYILRTANFVGGGIIHATKGAVKLYDAHVDEATDELKLVTEPGATILLGSADSKGGPSFTGAVDIENAGTIERANFSNSITVRNVKNAGSMVNAFTVTGLYERIGTASVTGALTVTPTTTYKFESANPTLTLTTGTLSLSSEFGGATTVAKAMCFVDGVERGVSLAYDTSAKTVTYALLPVVATITVDEVTTSYYSVEDALDAVLAAPMEKVVFVDAQSELPDVYAETCVLSEDGLQAWAKRAVYVTNTAGTAFALEDGTVVASTALREGDVLTYKAGHYTGNQWQVSFPTIGYPILVDYECSSYGIPANAQIELKTGAKLYFQGANDINDGAKLSGAGTFELNVVATVKGAATMTATLAGTGSFKLEDAATLTVASELAAGKVTVGEGRFLKFDEGTKTYSSAHLAATFNGENFETLKAALAAAAAAGQEPTAVTVVDTSITELPEGYSDYAIAENGAIVAATCKIGTSGYATLAKAIAAATAESEIEIIGETYADATELTKDITIKVADTVTQTISGVLSGSGKLTKVGAGELKLTAVNTFAGGLDVNAGEVFGGNANALGSGTITVNPTGVVVVQQYSSNTGYSVVLNGGVLKSPGANDAHGKLVKNLRLTANSTFEYTSEGSGNGLIGVGNSDDASTLDLNGFQLDLVGRNNSTRVYLDKITTMTAGTLRVVKGKLFLHCNTLTAPAGSKLIVESDATVELAKEVVNRVLSFPEIVYNGTVAPASEDVPVLTATTKFSGTGSLPKLAIADGATIDVGADAATVSGELTLGASISILGASAGDTILTVTGTKPASLPTIVGDAEHVLAWNGDDLVYKSPDPVPGEITISEGDSAQEVVVTVPVANAEGETVTVTATDKNGGEVSGSAKVTDGQAVITITGTVDTGYTFVTTVGTTPLEGATGTFFTGIDKVWFAASAVSGVSAVTNGTWNVTPAIDDGKYVINDPEGNRFVVDSAKQGEGDGKLAKIVQVVTFTSAIEEADLPSADGVLGAITVAQEVAAGEDAPRYVWMGVVGGAWATLKGATPELDTEYTVTVEYDRRGTDGVFTYKVDEKTLGTNTVDKTTGFSGVTAMGTGKLASIEATAGAEVPVAEGYVTAEENGKPIRVDNDSAAVFGADRAAVQAELLRTPVTGGLKVWEAYALGATAAEATAGVKPVISGAQTSDTDKMKIVDGFTVREHTGIAVTRKVLSGTDPAALTKEAGVTQEADGVSVALPEEGAKYIKIEYTFE